MAAAMCGGAAMKEYQIKLEGYRLPDAVYHQCIWTVRDIERARDLCIEYLAEDRGAEEAPGQVVSAAARLDAVACALCSVPGEYRQGVLESTMRRGGGFRDHAHETTWKRWKQRCIYRLAEELELV